MLREQSWAFTGLVQVPGEALAQAPGRVKSEHGDAPNSASSHFRRPKEGKTSTGFSRPVQKTGMRWRRGILGWQKVGLGWEGAGSRAEIQY